MSKTLSDLSLRISNFLKFINHIYMKSSGIVDNSKFIQNLIKDVEFISKFDVKKITSKDSFNIIIDKFDKSQVKTFSIWAIILPTIISYVAKWVTQWVIDNLLND